MKVFLNILKTIIVYPLALMGAICLIPLFAISIIIGLPAIALQDVWEKDL